MQVPRQALSFFQYRKRLGMSIKFRIDHGDSGLVGDTKRQVGMVCREIILPGFSDAHTADDPASYCQRYPHPRLHPFQQDSGPIL